MLTTRGKIAIPQLGIFWLFIVAYLYFFGAMLKGFPQVGTSTTGAIKEMAAFLLVLGIVTALVAQDWAGFRQVFRQSYLIVAYISLVFVSCLWSDAPGWTLFEGIRLAVAGAFGMAAAVQLGTEKHVRVLCCALLIIAIASAFLSIFLPGKGLMPASEGYAGAWRGVFLHKSYLGRAMALRIFCVDSI